MNTSYEIFKKIGEGYIDFQRDSNTSYRLFMFLSLSLCKLQYSVRLNVICTPILPVVESSVTPIYKLVRVCLNFCTLIKSGSCLLFSLVLLYF